MDITSIIIIIAVIMLLFAGSKLGSSGTYRHSSNNPYRRQCIKCGQEQMQYCHTMESWNDAWWEINGLILKPECECHRDIRGCHK